MKTDLSANAQIYEAIRQIALHRMINSGGAIKNTNKIHGFVVKVHTDPNDELLGTVDVQEYNLSNDANLQAVDEGMEVGLHKGVYLSAIQNNENGLVVVPYLYSDVVIVTDPTTLREYVVQYSHADKVQINAHNEVVIGAVETEDFEESDDTPDVDELKPTGRYAKTTYTPVSALIEAAAGDSASDKSSIEITPEHIDAKHDETQLWLDAQKLLAKYKAREIVIKEDAVYVGSGEATEPAVLGNELASLLIEWLGALSQMVTPTMMGPQPPANMVKFVELQAKINTYKAATTGILSKTVKIAR